jgi:hypothetical protein
MLVFVRLVCQVLQLKPSIERKQGTPFLIKMPEQVHVQTSQNNVYVIFTTINKIYLA